MTQKIFVFLGRNGGFALRGVSWGLTLQAFLPFATLPYTQKNRRTIAMGDINPSMTTESATTRGLAPAATKTFPEKILEAFANVQNVEQETHDVKEPLKLFPPAALWQSLFFIEASDYAPATPASQRQLPWPQGLQRRFKFPEEWRSAPCPSSVSLRRRGGSISFSVWLRPPRSAIPLMILALGRGTAQMMRPTS